MFPFFIGLDWLAPNASQGLFDLAHTLEGRPAPVVTRNCAAVRFVLVLLHHASLTSGRLSQPIPFDSHMDYQN